MENDEIFEDIPQRTYARHVVFYPVSFVWDIIRDFDDHGSWLPDVQATEILKDIPGNDHTIRRLQFVSGVYADEQVTKLDDEERVLEYALVGEMAWPIRDVRGIIALSGDENATLIERTVHFNFLGDSGGAGELVENFNATLQESLERLSIYLGKQLVGDQANAP